MRIAQVSTVGTPVRREGSDSVESLVWLLTRELTRMGHEVTVFAAGGSETHGELVAALPGPYGTDGSPDDWQVCEWINLCRAVEQSERFDVLHSHAYLWGLPLQGLTQAPLVHTLHVCPYENEARLWSLFSDATVTAISHYQWAAFPGLRPAAVIPHGVDPAQFTFRPEPEDYVCYLGRFTAGKGPLRAVEAAQALGLRLRLAGPADDYYHRYVAPLVDGRRVEYVGFVSGRERDQFLGGARALLYPLEDPEPFGLVQVEAMMCGTPVVATRLGAVPEIIDDGVTGYCAESAEDFVRLVPCSFALDRRRVRQRAEECFSMRSTAQRYAEVYGRLTTGRRAAVEDGRSGDDRSGVSRCVPEGWTVHGDHHRS
jgi:glycosyltransferase involved in cell wall biosynthesis